MLRAALSLLPLMMLACVGPVGSAATAAPAGKGPIVAIEGGRVIGVQSADRAVFRGLRFAAPPLGPLRWRPPAPVVPWAGVRDATRSGPSCAQLDDGWNRGNATYSAEDCLYLEVATPNLRPAKPLPVFVWLHGGSNKAGGAAGLVSSSIVRRGIVLVAVQYRLGPLGFMAHPALTAESPNRASGNYGLMDQQAALRWVRRNIARFGGDPARVTLGGESAGAMDVNLQQVSPLAGGLFHAAIQESGTAGFGLPPRTLRTSEELGERLATRAGRPHATAAQLRALPVATLLQAAKATPLTDLPEAGSPWTQTVIDGHVITEPPAVTLARGGGQKVPLLIGSNAREIDFYGDVEAARARMPFVFGARDSMAARFYGLDRADPPVDPVRGSVPLQIATDALFTCPAGFIAEARHRTGLPVWRYDFAFQPVRGPALGHASELRYVFGNPGEIGIAIDAPPLQAYWANFIRSGNPNGVGLVVWPDFGRQRRHLTFAAGVPLAGADLQALPCEGWTRP